MVFKIRKAVEESLQKAEAYYGEKIPRPTILFDLKGTAAGQSNFSKRHLRFNLKLSQENESDFLNVVVPHECAHFCQRWKFGYPGVKPHGKEWRKIMIDIFHLPPTVRHRFDTSRVAKKQKKYDYSCRCPGRVHHMSAIKHNKIRRGNLYFCTKCRTNLVFTSPSETLGTGGKSKFLDETL